MKSLNLCHTFGRGQTLQMNSAAQRYIKLWKKFTSEARSKTKEIFFSKQRDDYLVQWLDFYGLILYVYNARCFTTYIKRHFGLLGDLCRFFFARAYKCRKICHQGHLNNYKKSILKWQQKMWIMWWVTFWGNWTRWGK